ncbi:MAG: HIRAN domain-containing protein [Candidatus Acidiferrales bacterium]
MIAEGGPDGNFDRFASLRHPVLDDRAAFHTESPSRTNRVFFQQVHGINYKNDDGASRQAIIGRCCEGEELVLVPEPTNPYDPDAVKICRRNGEQLGYWPADGRMAHDLANGWTYRVTIDEIYSFKENHKKHGVRLRVEVLTMSHKTEERRKRAAAKAQAGPQAI